MAEAYRLSKRVANRLSVRLFAFILRPSMSQRSAAKLAGWIRSPNSYAPHTLKTASDSHFSLRLIYC